MINVQIFDLTLRDLLLFKSLYFCSTATKIIELVRSQPKPLKFYKSCFELDFSNMVSILAFDHRSVSYLLDDCYKEYFDEKYPLFYKTKFKKRKGGYCYRSAIDNALRVNQITAVNLIIAYIVKYQNNFLSSFLLKKTLPDLI